jgi:hypothetical protein
MNYPECVCKNCNTPFDEHYNDKCLFQPTTFDALLCSYCSQGLIDLRRPVASSDQWFRLQNGGVYHDECFSLMNNG